MQRSPLFFLTAGLPFVISLPLYSSLLTWALRSQVCEAARGGGVCVCESYVCEAGVCVCEGYVCEVGV